MGQAKPRFCSRCLSVVSQGALAGKEKERDFISARVACSVAQPRFNNPLVNNLFHNQRHDLEQEDSDPFSGDCCTPDTPPSGNLWLGFHHGD